MNNDIIRTEMQFHITGVVTLSKDTKMVLNEFKPCRWSIICVGFMWLVYRQILNKIFIADHVILLVDNKCVVILRKHGK